MSADQQKRMSSRPAEVGTCARWLHAVACGAVMMTPAIVLAAPRGDEDGDQTAHEEQNSAGEPPAKVRLHFELGGLGYRGSWTRQRYRDASGASLRMTQHGGELLGGVINVVVKRDGATTTYHSENGTAGFLFGGTKVSNISGEAANKPKPRDGFNFGLVAEFRENAGIAVGGVCGGSLSGIVGSSVLALTQSSLPGNHLEVDLGVAGGLECAPKDTLILLQYGVEGNLGVEQMQDLSSQQGLDDYDAGEGNGLLFYPGHGPRLLAVRDTQWVHGVLLAEYTRSFGNHRWGGKRQTARVSVALAFGKKAAFGIAPWYRFDTVDYSVASKVIDPNDRRGHTFGFSFVYARTHKDTD